MRSILLSSLLWSMALADTFNVGEAKDYKAKRDAVKLGKNAVWLSKQESEGFDIQTSPDVTKKLQDALFECNKLDNACYQKLYSTLRSADLEIDEQVYKRDFALAAIGGVISAFAAVAMQLYAPDYDSKQHRPVKIPDLHHLPEDKVNQGSKFQEGTPITIEYGPSSSVVVTPTPEPTQESHMPTVVPIAEAGNGYEEGDLKIELDKDVAERLNKVIENSQDCKEGWELDGLPQDDKEKRQLSTNAMVLCGAMGTVVNVAQGGTAAAILSYKGPDIKFKAGDIQKSSRVLIEFVKAYAPLISLKTDEVARLANLALSLSYDVFAMGMPVATDNRVPEKILTLTETEKKKCPPRKQLHCWSSLCHAVDRFRCTRLWKGCVCDPLSSNGIADRFYWGENYGALADFMAGFDPDADVTIPEAECSKDKGKDTYVNILSEDWKRTIEGFCEKKKGLSGSITETRQTPKPAGNEAWDGQWDVEFKFDTSKDKDCTRYKCSDVFGAFANCTSGDSAYKSGKLTLGCGTASYEFKQPIDTEKPKGTELKLASQICYPRNGKGLDYDHHELAVDWFAEDLCFKKVQSKAVKAGQKETFSHHVTPAGAYAETWERYILDAYWEDGCELESGEKEQDLNKPLGDDGPSCHDIFTKEILKSCHNKNRKNTGGQIQAGCVVYKQRTVDAETWELIKSKEEY